MSEGYFGALESEAKHLREQIKASPGDKVLVEAEILGVNEVDGKMLVIIDGLSQFVPLSSIRPMTRKEGE